MLLEMLWRGVDSYLWSLLKCFYDFVDAFACSSFGPISRVGKSFIRLRCVHVCRLGTWEQHGRQKEVVLHLNRSGESLNSMLTTS